MSLNFSFTKVRDRQRVTIDPVNPKNWHPVAETLAWMSMTCGFNKITEANADRISGRLMAYQAAFGPLLRRGKPAPEPGFEEVYITADDVNRYIGMTTNASAMSDAQWLKHLATCVMSKGQDLMRVKRLSAVETHGEFEGEAYETV